MAFPILGTPKPCFLDSSGAPLASGTITILYPNNDTVKATYPTAADADASTNGTSGDITLDARGEPTSTQLWGRDAEDYKIIIKDINGDTIYTLNNIRLPGHSRRATVTFTNGDTTPTIAESDTFLINTSSDVTITDFDDGVVGDIIHVIGLGTTTAATLTHNASQLILANGKDLSMTQATVITLAMLSDQVWIEIGRTYATGTDGSSPLKYKTADQSLTTTAFAADTHLINFPVNALTYYKVRGYLAATSDGLTQDLKLDFIISGGVTLSSLLYYTVDEDGATGATVTGSAAGAILTERTFDILANKTIGIHLIGTFLSTSNDLVDIRIAQGTAAGTTTLKKGSWLSIEQMGK